MAQSRLTRRSPRSPDSKNRDRPYFSHLEKPTPRSPSAHGPLNRGPASGRLSGGGFFRRLVEQHPAATPVDVDRVLRREAAFEDALRERVLDLRLDRALERPRAVDRVEADLGELADRGVRDLEAEVHLRKPRLQRVELDARDRLDVLLGERVAHHDLVDPVT